MFPHFESNYQLIFLDKRQDERERQRRRHDERWRNERREKWADFTVGKLQKLHKHADDSRQSDNSNF